MVVTVQDGRAVDLRGDKNHPFTRGFLCNKVAHYLDRTYHPDRLRQPLKRVGPKGSGRFEPISWDEAIATIAGRFRAIVDSPHGPQAILPYSYAGTMGKIQGESLDRRFFHRLGASLLDRTICATAGVAGSEITLGTRAVIDPEAIVNARTIINWGSNTVVTNSHLWSLMIQARKRGAIIITIDPYRSPTAARSDWWVPVRPGTDAALALGMMHIIWREGWQDDDYISRYCLGGEQLRDRVMREFAPQVVSQITGLPIEDISRLASSYAQSFQQRGGPSLIRVNYGMQRHRGGGMAVRTVTCLPAIVGAWRHIGGGALLSTSKLYPFNTARLQRPDLIRPGTRTINMVQLAEALHGELPGPPVLAIFVYNSNPAAVCPDQSRVLSGLNRDDLFTVVHDQFLTDTAEFADIVLPATTQLEHFDIHGSYGHAYVQTNEQAIEPLGEAKPNTEVFRLLASALGFERDLFDATDEDLARQALDVLPNGRFPSATWFDGIDRERLRREGPIRLNIPREFAPFAEGGFNTRSGKCELFSPALEANGLDPLPNYTPPSEDPLTRPDLADRYPLQLLTPPSPSFLNSTFVNVDVLRAAAGERWLEIHPSDATARGITDGQAVRVFNDRGSFRVRARLADSVKPGVVVTLGCWWRKYTDEGVNCNVTTSTTLTDFGAGGTFFDNLVQVEPVSR
jgi:anaerobic selenocysteine-containing dehydrogenase